MASNRHECPQGTAAPGRVIAVRGAVVASARLRATRISIQSVPASMPAQAEDVGDQIVGFVAAQMKVRHPCVRCLQVDAKRYRRG